MQMRVTPALVTKIAAESARDPKTVRTVLAGGGSSTSRQSVEDACKRLGISAPTSAQPRPKPA